MLEVLFEEDRGSLHGHTLAHVCKVVESA
jgi:hypothetical protein